MATRPEEELNNVLGIAEEARAINKDAIGRSYEPSPFGWTMQALENATELKAFAQGLQYALTMESPLAEELLEKGAERFIQDRQDVFEKRVRDSHRVQELGGKNG